MPVLFLLIWLTSFEQAQTLAIEEQKPILLVFSGSDWCRPCIQLDREVFQDSSFLAFADSELILLKADFPRSKKNRLPKELQSHNERLAQRYNPKGEFPLVLLLDKSGKEITRTGYRSGGSNAFISFLKANWP